MLRIRHFISKVRPELESPVSTNSGLADVVTPRLLSEIWRLILTYVKRRKDLFALSRTSTMLRALALSRIFETVDTNTYRCHRLRQTKFRIATVLRSPEIGPLITRFRVSLDAWHMCQKVALPIHKFNPFSARWCTCNSIDTLFGDILKAMVKLKSLELHCFLCKDNNNQRHSYIGEMEKRNLQILSFCCCCTSDTSKQEETLFSAPVLSSLKALRLYTGLSVPESSSTKRILDDPRIMPCLSILSHHRTELNDAILASRPIERLWVPGRGDLEQGFIDAFLVSPGTFTHIIMHNFSGLCALHSVEPSLFAHLQHIGSIPPDESIEFLLAPYQSLHHLTSIDAVVDDYDEDPWNVDLLARLSMLHRNLRMVLCGPLVFYIWERQGNEWERRQVGYFGPWEIIIGACDQL